MKILQQQKLINGLEAACRHTKISREQVIAIGGHITGEIMQRQVGIITTKELGEMVMRHLQALDVIAYIRFACVYNRFKEIKELMEAITTIQSKDAKQQPNDHGQIKNEEVCNAFASKKTEVAKFKKRLEEMSIDDQIASRVCCRSKKAR